MERKPPTLLVVDDDPLNLDMLAHRLEREGYMVAKASDGPEALAYLENHPIDLILLDYHMPDMTGLDVLQVVRRKRTPSDLPVLMVTAVTDAETVVAALNLGANDYITKPVDFAVALARISSQLTRRDAERELRLNDLRDAGAARAGSDGLWDWNLETNEIYYSPRWKAMLGFSDDQIENSPAEWLSRVHPDDSNRVQHDLEAAISGLTESFESEHRLQHKDQSWRWVLTRGKATLSESCKALRLAGSQTDITESKTADPLTNLPNRLRFAERVSKALARSKYDGGYAFAVLLLDVDRFKVINDSLGHLVGDELLVGIARRLRCSDERFPVTLARLGGDEFGILIDEIPGAAGAIKVAQWVARTLASPFPLEGREVYCSMSIGIALGPGTASKPEDILRDADTAMYRAKALGGGRFEIFDNEMRRRALARMELETDLRRAIENQEFELHYLPKVDMLDGSVMGFEALVRWKHPTNGLVKPEDFIPLADETGLIIPLGAWVLERACRQLAIWQAVFPHIPALTMSVNASSRQLLDENFGSRLERVLHDTGISPGTLRLELTESALMQDVVSVRRVMSQLKGIGVGLKLDDFGAGYSSLSNLCRLPLDTLKIDRCFVNDLGKETEAADIVKTILRLAAGLRLDVVAEGVETQQQADLLRGMGCRYAQGFHYFRPIEASGIPALLAGQPACSPTPVAC